MKNGRREDATRARLLWALGFSVICHAAVLAVLGDWRLDESSTRGAVVMVALLGGGDSGTGDGSDGATGNGSATNDPEALAPADQRPAPDRAALETAPAREPVREKVARKPVAKAERRPSESSRPIVDDSQSGAKPVSESGAAAGEMRPSAAPAAGSGDGAGGRGSGGGTGGSGEGSGVGAGGSSDLRASCRSCPTPDYPARARRQGWQGTVDVQVRVGRDGAVEQAEIGRSSGFALLDDAAVTVARRSRFWVSSEGELRGRLRYRFILEETAGGPL